MATLQDLLIRLWNDYEAINSQAGAIHDLIQNHHRGTEGVEGSGGAGGTIINDHIAFRTFDDPRIDIDALARTFVELGYVSKGHYQFPEKKLIAQHYEHLDSRHPKIFISELRVEQLSRGAQEIIKNLIDQIPMDWPQRWDFCVSGRPWSVSYVDDEVLRRESEYAAWLAAWGFRANHFTIDVGRLGRFKSLVEFNYFVERHGFKLNASGGKVKGSPADYLEQSSTLAAKAPVDFMDGPRSIPACYYEFAWRHPMPDGRRFEGFIAANANKIFESTDRQGV